MCVYVYICIWSGYNLFLTDCWSSSWKDTDLVQALILQWLKDLNILNKKNDCILLYFFERGSLNCVNVFTYFWLPWVFVAVHRLSLVVASGGCSLAARWLLIAVASLVKLLGAWAMVSAAHELNSCGSRALKSVGASCCVQALVAPQHVESTNIKDQTH